MSKMIFEIYGVENCKIELVELFPCHSKEELNAREGFYIRGNECVNNRIPHRTRAEYYESNKEALCEKVKQYQAKTNVKVLCECGGSYTNIYKKKKHLTTQKHKMFIQSPP
jgi:hypothetical protein